MAERIAIRNPELCSRYSAWHWHNMPSFCGLSDIDGYIRSYDSGITHLIEDRARYTKREARWDKSFRRVLIPFCHKYKIDIIHNVTCMDDTYSYADHESAFDKAERVNNPDHGRVRRSAHILWMAYQKEDVRGLYVTLRNRLHVERTNGTLDWFITHDADCDKLLDSPSLFAQLAIRCRVPFRTLKLRADGTPDPSDAHWVRSLYS